MPAKLNLYLNKMCCVQNHGNGGHSEKSRLCGRTGDKQSTDPANPCSVILATPGVEIWEQKPSRVPSSLYYCEAKNANSHANEIWAPRCTGHIQCF